VIAKLALVALAPSVLSGCLHVCYLAQAAAGQDEIAHRARPIDDVLVDRTVPERTREHLALIEDVKRFSESRGLTRTGSYRHFVDLRRDAVVWVVTASHRLRFEPVTWRFPIVGTVPYLGWFEKRDAQLLASSLRREGHDVHLREARAYSTLGWFDDPVLSTMLGDDPADLVDVVIHESTHATYFVPSQTVFNESLANFVADSLTPEYLRERMRADPWRLHDYRERQRMQDNRVRRMHETYLELSKLYASRLGDEDKLARKEASLTALRRELGIAGALNNAVLAQAQTYNSGTEAFAKLLQACHGDWPRFLAAVRSIDRNAFARIDQRDIDPVILAATKRVNQAARF
jgi:predicted aminopeptidase